MKKCQRLHGERGELRLVADRIQAVQGAYALVICTEWKQFRSLDFGWLKEQFAMPVVIYGRNLFEPAAVRRAGCCTMPWCVGIRCKRSLAIDWR